MASSVTELERTIRARSVTVNDEAIAVRLNDGRIISVPTKWYPRLLHATPAERSNYEIDNCGITWPDVEADFSIRGILFGQKSGESAASLKFWLDNRRKGRKVTFEDYMKSRRMKSNERKLKKTA